MDLDIKKVMSSHLLVAQVDEDLTTAYFRMKRVGARHLPVVDENRNLVGIISDRDFQRGMWPISTLDDLGFPEVREFKSGALVSEYMSSPVKSISLKDDLLKAVDLMIDEKISSLVIVENEKMLGIITHEDLLKVLKVLLNKPGNIKQKAASIAYNSPIGMVTDFLSGVGI